MNKKWITGLLVATVCIVAITLVAIFLKEKKTNEQNMEKKYEAIPSEEKDEDLLTYEGKQYIYNTDLRTMLFMGVDKASTLQEERIGNGGQTDSLILVIFDQEKKTYRLLTVSRDTMTEIRTYDGDGNLLGTERAQLALQYAYGDGERRSCQLTKKAVSKLLYEVPIHSYMALTMEGFAVLTDALGGIELTIPKDYTNLDPRFEEGKTILMDGKTTERYVRMRDIEETGSSVERLRRQEQFLSVLIEKLQELMETDADRFPSFWKVASPYMQTDLTVEELQKWFPYEKKGDVASVPGKIRGTEKYDEYIVDEEGLKKLVIELFYKEKK